MGKKINWTEAIRNNLKTFCKKFVSKPRYKAHKYELNGNNSSALFLWKMQSFAFICLECNQFYEMYAKYKVIVVVEHGMFIYE